MLSSLTWKDAVQLKNGQFQTYVSYHYQGISQRIANILFLTNKILGFTFSEVTKSRAKKSIQEPSYHIHDISGLKHNKLVDRLKPAFDSTDNG